MLNIVIRSGLEDKIPKAAPVFSTYFKLSILGIIEITSPSESSFPK